MSQAPTSLWRELATPALLDPVERLARRNNWGVALLLIGWLHLLAFSLCDYLSVAHAYHDAAGYLAIWVAELSGVWIILRLSKGAASPEAPVPLARFVVRVWVGYFVLAFNLGTLNTLRGNKLFEFFPAMALLASFAFLVLAFTISRRFFAAVLVMLTAGVLMSANLMRSYLTFAIAWWLVLQGIGLVLLLRRRTSQTSSPLAVPQFTHKEPLQSVIPPLRPSE